MSTQELQRKIEDFREMGIPQYIPRANPIHLVDRMVSTIVGARRSGKSYRAWQVADELLKQKKIRNILQICPLDFDNPILSSMKANQLHQIQDTLLKISPKIDLKTPLIFILDEIHKIKGWEEYVIDLSRNPNWKVIVTGSSSKLLQSDVSTELRGKAISSINYPLSFKEFLRFNDFNYKPNSTKGLAEKFRLFDEFLKWGSYPATVQTNPQIKETLLHEYFSTMILKDVIQRYNISKPRQCIQLYHYLLSNMAKPFTIQSAYDFLKNSGYTTSKDSVRDYIQWAEDSWFLFSVPIFSSSQKEIERNYKKIYCVDWSLAIHNSLTWDGGYSRAFENMIYLQLKRSYPRVCYYLTRKRRNEIDFVCINSNGKIELAVQVCMNITNQETLKREITPLISTANYFGIKSNIIITYNQENVFSQDGVKVNAVPAWKWL